MKTRISALLAALVISTAVHADHHVVVVDRCVTDAGRAEVQLVEVFDVNTSEVLGSWTKETFNDPESGLEPWMADKWGENWRAHEAVVYEQVVGKCPRKVSL